MGYYKAGVAEPFTDRHGNTIATDTAVWETAPSIDTERATRVVKTADGSYRLVDTDVADGSFTICEAGDFRSVR